jgi:hypothetical protein
MRLRELQLHERAFLIYHGWRSMKVRHEARWYNEVLKTTHMTQDEAVRIQKVLVLCPNGPPDSEVDNGDERGTPC